MGSEQFKEDGGYRCRHIKAIGRVEPGNIAGSRGVFCRLGAGGI